MLIHNTAIVHPSADIHETAQIGAFTHIGEHVSIGANTIIHNGCQIEHAIIGENCQIHSYAIVGTPPQDLSYGQEITHAIIGNNVTIREFVTINRGTTKDAGKTIIGDRCYLMAYAHVGHDCVLDADVIMVNSSTLGGHVHVGKKAFLSAFFAAHQRVKIGAYSLCAAQSAATLSIPPFTVTEQRRAKILRVNTIGLSRAGYTKEQIKKVQWAYEILRQKAKPDALTAIKQEGIDIHAELLGIITDFYENTQGGIIGYVSEKDI